jgi:dTDP-4-dehydrorhamnose reductase
MRILVTGAAGQLGRALRPALEPRHAVTWTDLPQLDVCDEDALRAAGRAVRPEAILHLAAWTDVDACEADPERATRINALGTRHAARAAAEVGARLVFLSSDYVFDGRLTRPYREDDAPNPLNAYGRSKLDGEAAVIELAPRHRIVRTSGLFGPGGANFPGAILRARARDGRVRVVADQTCRPTYAAHLAAALASIVEAAGEGGVLHVASAGATSWFDFARAVLRAAGDDPAAVEPIASAALDRRARRPANSVLDTGAYETAFGRLPHWSEGLPPTVAAWREGEEP